MRKLILLSAFLLASVLAQAQSVDIVFNHVSPWHFDDFRNRPVALGGQAGAGSQASKGREANSAKQAARRHAKVPINQSAP